MAVPNDDGLNYAYKRVTYICMVVAQALLILREERGGSPRWSVAAIPALIMARNLDDFFFPEESAVNCRNKMEPGKKYADGVFLSDFFPSWSTDGKARLSPDDRKRINKIAGHIVGVEQQHFGRDVPKLVMPLLTEGCEFLRQCRRQEKARDTGYARKYRKQLQEMLEKLGIEAIE